MTELEKKMINYYLDRLDEVARKMEEAEEYAEMSQKESDDILSKEHQYAYKYGCMCALSKIYAGSVKISTNELRSFINTIIK